MGGLRGWPLAAHAAWAAGAATLTFIDIGVRRLPHRITATTAIAFLTLLLPSQQATDWLRAVLAGLALAAFFGAIATVAPRDLGLGDVTVAFPVGALLGWHSWTALAAGTLLGLAAASRHRRHSPTHRTCPGRRPATPRPLPTGRRIPRCDRVVAVPHGR